MQGAGLSTSSPTDGVTQNGTVWSNPWIVTYDVRDKADPPNNAQRVYRRVRVICQAGEYICPSGSLGQDAATLQCSCGGLCGVCGGSTASPAPQPLSLANLSLTLNGPSTVTITIGSQFLPCSATSSISCDLGATATLLSIGDYSKDIVACRDQAPTGVSCTPYSIGANGLSCCSFNTKQVGNYSITYSMAFDSSINVTRTLEVVPRCSDGEYRCGPSCCELIQDSQVEAPQAIKVPASLTLSPLSPSQINIQRGSVYSRCYDGQEFTLASPCEAGAVATDPDDSTLQSRVLMCPSKKCLANSSNCQGQRLLDKQLIDCGFDSTTAGIDSSFSLDFYVYDSQGLLLTVSRTLTVVSPCSTGQFYCNGDCYNVSDRSSLYFNSFIHFSPSSQVNCDTLNQFASSAAPPSPATSPPSLYLLPSSPIAGTSSSSLTIQLSYGSPAPYSLLPCPSFSSANSSSTITCAAAAYDAVDQDLTSSISVTITSSGNTICSLSSISQGTCIPGSYALDYSVTNSQGLTTAAVLTVLIEEISSVVLNYSFVPSAVTGAENQAAYALSLPSNNSAAMALIIQQLPFFGYDPSLLRSAVIISVSVTPRLTAVAALSWSVVSIVWRISLGTLPASTFAYQINSGSGSRRLSEILREARSLVQGNAEGCSSLGQASAAPKSLAVNPIVSFKAPVLQCATPPVDNDSILKALIFSAIVNVTNNNNLLTTAEATTLVESGATAHLLDSIDSQYKAAFQSYFANQSDADASFSTRASTIASSTNTTLQALSSLVTALADSLIGSGTSQDLTSDSVLQA